MLSVQNLQGNPYTFYKAIANNSYRKFLELLQSKLFAVGANVLRNFTKYSLFKK